MVMLLRCAFGRHMVEGEGEWQGVPDVLRSSFLLLVKELRRVSARLATLEAAAAIKDQRLEENSMEPDENDSCQQQMQETSGVLKRIQEVETVSRQAIEHVAVVQHMLQQINEATAKREGGCVVASMCTSHSCLDGANVHALSAGNLSAARWKRQVRRLHDEIKHLVALAGASSQTAGRVIPPATTSPAPTTPKSSRRDLQCDFFSWSSREGEEQTIEDTVRVFAGMSSCKCTRDACEDSEIQANDIAVLMCDPKSPVCKAHVSAAPKRRAKCRRAVDLRIEKPSPPALDNQPESHHDRGQRDLVIPKKLNCESDRRTNIMADASASATRETVALLSKSLPGSVRSHDDPTSIQDLTPDPRVPSIDASSTTNGQRRLATLRARYAEARRKQQQSLSQLRAIGE
jgi:hypothetical protein